MSEPSVRPVFKRVSSRHVADAPLRQNAPSAGAPAASVGLLSALPAELPAGYNPPLFEVPSAAPPVTIFNTPTSFRLPATDLPVLHERDNQYAEALSAAAVHTNEGTAYLTQGKFDEAERRFLLALNISQDYLGHYSTGLARALERLASFYLTCGHYHKAGPLLKRLYEIRLQQHADGLHFHSHVQARENYLLMALTVEKCSSCLEKLNLPNECEKIFLTLLKRQEEHYGPEHTFTLDALERLGGFYLRARVYGLAQVVFEKLYETKSRVYGEYSMEVSAVLSDLALIYGNLEMYAAQVVVLERQVFLLDTVHGGSGLSLASSLVRLAEALARAAGDVDIFGYAAGANEHHELSERAALIFRRALTIFEKHYGPSTPTVVGLRAKLRELAYSH